MKNMFTGRSLALFALAFTQIAFSQSWVQLQPTGTPPPGRMNNTAVLDPLSERLIVFGGFNSDTCCQTSNDVWVLTHANGYGGTRQWMNLIPNGAAGSPPPLAAASAVYDVRSNRMIVFGGQDGTMGISSAQVWILKNANGLDGTPSWYRVQFPAGAAAPAPRQNHEAAYDLGTNRMIVFGGLSSVGAGPVPLNDLWVLTNANGTQAQAPQWIQLKPSGILPSPRHAFAAAYDTLSNRLTIFGGCVDAAFACDNSLASTELWVLSNATGTTWFGAAATPAWTRLQYFGAAPISHAQYAVSGYDLLTNRLFVMGGRIGSAAPFGTFTYFTWVLSKANGLGGTPAWTMLTPGASPEPRGQSVPPNLLDPISGRLMVFGGPGLNDTWILNTRTGTKIDDGRLDR
jgi:hypothetical protein